MPKNVDPHKVFLECSNASMGLSKKVKLDYIVMVNPTAYYNTRYDRKQEITAALEKSTGISEMKTFTLCFWYPGK